MMSVPTLEQGRIVWAELTSSDGTKTKRRPAVIITSNNEITVGQPFVVVAACNTFMPRETNMAGPCRCSAWFGGGFSAVSDASATRRFPLRQFKDRGDWIGQEFGYIGLALAKQIFDVSGRSIAHV